MKLTGTMQYHPLMSKLGFTYNEAEVFLYLTKNGESLGPEIYPDLEMDKSSFYRAVSSLISKKMIYAIGEERNRRFGANPISSLEEMINHEEVKLNQAKEAFSQLPRIIDGYIGTRYHQKNITVIKDAETYNYYLYSRLQCKSKLVRDLSGNTTAAVYYDNYNQVMKDFISKRAKAGILLHQLTTSDDIGVWDVTSKKMNKEVRILPKKFKHQAVFAAWDETSVFFSKDRGNLIGVAIKDQLITQLLCSMFDAIWDVSKIHR